MSVGPAEILVILIVGLLVFGPHKLPEVGRQVGAAVRELRKMQDAVRGELDMVLHPEHGTRAPIVGPTSCRKSPKTTPRSTTGTSPRRSPRPTSPICPKRPTRSVASSVHPTRSSDP